MKSVTSRAENAVLSKAFIRAGEALGEWHRYVSCLGCAGIHCAACTSQTWTASSLYWS